MNVRTRAERKESTGRPILLFLFRGVEWEVGRAHSSEKGFSPYPITSGRKRGLRHTLMSLWVLPRPVKKEKLSKTILTNLFLSHKFIYNRKKRQEKKRSYDTEHA